ncbi:MAG: AAA family ATPase [Myxococcales bacterium]|nr:AAA family ATPase [Myxococcales bacterium]
MGVHVEFPVFVTSASDRRPQHKYQVQSVFVPDVVGRGRTFDRAMRECAKATRRRFQDVAAERATVRPLQWMAFNPELRVRKVELTLREHGGHQSPLTVTVALFEVGEQPFACVPRFHGQVVRLPTDTKWPEQVSFLERALALLLKQMRQELDPEPVRLAPFAVHKGDFVTSLAVTLPVTRGRFHFDPVDASGVFASTDEVGEFVGSVEIRKVAADLADAYPDDLKRTLVDDPRVQLLSDALFEGRPEALVLLGPPGAGRTTLLHEAVARRLDVHATQQGRLEKVPRVWHLDPVRVITGMSLIGAWQRRAESIFCHLRDRLRTQHDGDRTDALFVDNAVALCRVGKHSGGNLTLSSVLRPFVERRELPVILEASVEEWQRMEELDRPFADLFRPIRVPAPERADALRIVIAHRARLERFSGCTVDRSVVRRLVDLDDRYPGTRAAPGSLVERLERLADQHPGQRLSAADVDRAFLGRTGMRQEMLDPHAPLEEERLRERLEKRLVGQPEAIDALSDIIHVLRAGVAPPGRPAGSMLLVGPTGVGKTETAKVLASTVYEDPDALVRFDMNEYVDASAAQRLIGDGHSGEGQLTGRVRYRPFCVLLLDEIEKAHPSVHDLLLQLLDEGRLTDGMGRVADFGQAVVVLTSNVGATEAGRKLGFGADPAAAAATYRSALTRAFRPEFLNRIDRVVVFRPLARDHIRHIARIQLGQLLGREGMLRRTLIVEVDDEVLEWVSGLGFDPELGARALKRALERELVGPIADAVVPLAVDEPAVLTLTAREGGGVQLEASPLPLRERGSEHVMDQLLTGPRTQAVRWLAEQTRAAMDRLSEAPLVASAVAGPSDVELPPSMGILGRLRELAASLETEHDEDEERMVLGSRAASQAIERSKPRSRFYKRMWAFGPDQKEQLVHEHVRDVMQDLMSQPGVEHGALTLEDFSVAEAVFTIARARPQVAARDLTVRVHNLTPAAAGSHVWTSMMAANLAKVVETFGGAVQVAAEHTGTTLEIHGACFDELLEGEWGVHLYYPPDHPPLAVRVSIGEEPARARAVRLYCPAAHDPGSVTDLRSGQVVPWADLDLWLPRWMVRSFALGGVSDG